MKYEGDSTLAKVCLQRMHSFCISGLRKKDNELRFSLHCQIFRKLFRLLHSLLQLQKQEVTITCRNSIEGYMNKTFTIGLETYQKNTPNKYVKGP